MAIFRAVFTLFLVMGIQWLTEAADFKVKSVWVSNTAISGMKYLAVVEDTAQSYSGDKIIIFDELNGKVKAHYYTLFQLNFYPHTNATFVGNDGKYGIKGKVLRKNKLLKLDLLFEDGGSTELNYEMAFSQKLFQCAYKAIKLVENRREALASQSEPESLTQFKQMLIGIKDEMGYLIGPDRFYPLEIQSGQAEQEWGMTLPSSALTDAIQWDGSDAISRRFREAGNWSKESDIPAQGKGTYSFFRKVSQEFKVYRHRMGADKYVSYEIVNVSFVKCGRRYEKISNIIWILKDGSSFSYLPYLECDDQ